jgi:uncharacterized protein (TIGR03435 family)
MRFLTALLLAGLALGAERRFEVASVKPSRPGTFRVTQKRLPGGRFEASWSTLKALIAYAWDVREQDVLGGPAWANTDTFDIQATPDGPVPNGPEGGPVIREMLRTLLTERFGLAIRREPREVPVYALAQAKSGLKIKAVPEGGPGQGTIQIAMGRLDLTGGISELTMVLSKLTGRAVTDETGLTGIYEMHLVWTPDPGQLEQIAGLVSAGPQAAPGDAPTLFTALQEQLGLRLESKRAKVDAIVIERAERPGLN